MKEEEMKHIAEWIVKVLENPQDDKVLGDVKAMVYSLCRRFPLGY
jgi:glycine/serine hydroxymethyltransferase